MREEILERDQFDRIVRFDIILDADQLFEINGNLLTGLDVKDMLMFDAARRLLNNPDLDGISFVNSGVVAAGNRLEVNVSHRSAPADSGTEMRPFQTETVSKAMDVAIFAEDSSPARARIVSGLTGDLVGRILKHPQDIYRITPQQFEELVMDRLAAMRYEVKQVGKTNRPDGGIDIVFSSRPGDGLALLGAIQVKHHTRPNLKSGVEVVHAMAGVLERHRGPFNLGMVVTNTSFTREATWFVEPFKLFLRLRDRDDIQRWVAGDFANPRERREIPTSIALRSGFVLDLKADKQ